MYTPELNVVSYIGGLAIVRYLSCVSLYPHTYIGIWEKMNMSGNKPPKLSGHTLTKINATSAMLFGGQTNGRCINDTYILSMDTWVREFPIHVVSVE